LNLMPLYQQILFVAFCFLMLVVVYWQIKEREIVKREQQRHQNLNHNELDCFATDRRVPLPAFPLSVSFRREVPTSEASDKATNKVIKLLRKADPDTYIGASIHAAIRAGRICELILTLQQQGRDCPPTLENVIGYEAFEALMRLKLIDQGVNV
jgi:hypothetical protein